MEQHRFVEVRFDRVNDNPQAFANANTLDELRQLNAP
jgi:molybdopterin-guanine dinucleotide biosynthesis protein A